MNSFHLRKFKADPCFFRKQLDYSVRTTSIAWLSILEEECHLRCSSWGFFHSPTPQLKGFWGLFSFSESRVKDYKVSYAVQIVKPLKPPLNKRSQTATTTKDRGLKDKCQAKLFFHWRCSLQLLWSCMDSTTKHCGRDGESLHRTEGDSNYVEGALQGAALQHPVTKHSSRQYL